MKLLSHNSHTTISFSSVNPSIHLGMRPEPTLCMCIKASNLKGPQNLEKRKKQTCTYEQTSSLNVIFP